MKRLHQLSKLIARIETVLLALCMLTMLGVAFFQVVMRNIYDVGYIWADQLVRLLVLWVGLLGAAVATSESRHLSIDVITKFTPPRLTKFLKTLVRIFALVVCVHLARASWDYVQLEKGSGGTFVFGIPVWVTEIIIPIGFVLISFHFFVLILEGISELVTHREINQDPA